MSHLRQLALAWQQRADQDAQEAVRREIVGSELRLVAHTRRNCAWELLKMLNELEKESPADGGVGVP